MSLDFHFPLEVLLLCFFRFSSKIPLTLDKNMSVSFLLFSRPKQTPAFILLPMEPGFQISLLLSVSEPMQPSCILDSAPDWSDS